MSFYDAETDEEYICEYQKLINTGTAWKMEGSVGREAMNLIEDGLCALGEEAHYDYWGNRVPSRTDVKSGSKGSEEFVKSMSPYGKIMA